MLNTLNFVENMTKAGMSEPVAETLANELDKQETSLRDEIKKLSTKLDELSTKLDQFATKQDLAKEQLTLAKEQLTLAKEHLTLAKEHLTNVEKNILTAIEQLSKSINNRINSLMWTNGIFHTLILLLLGVLLSFALIKGF